MQCYRIDWLFLLGSQCNTSLDVSWLAHQHVERVELSMKRNKSKCPSQDEPEIITDFNGVNR